MLRRRFLQWIGAVPAWWTPLLRADGPSNAPPNWQLPTLGGRQYWADEQIFRNYRIQRNAATGHHRLLDPDDERLAWGTFEQCRTKLDALIREERLKPPPKRITLTLHGIARSRHSMNGLAAYLREHGPATVYQVGYPGTLESIPQSAATLDRLVQRLTGVEEIDVVAFSMGNLILRHWLGDRLAAARGGVEETAPGATPPDDGSPRPRLRRCVMIGPPNHGAVRAKLWQASPLGRELFSLALGDAGEQLGVRFSEIRDRLAVPEGEFAIIAGGKGDADGWHAAIPGDDDGTVGVDETKLPGAADFAVVPVRHTWLTTDRRVCAMTSSFLNHGYFRSAGERSPIARA